ncbi:hypothetical protein NC797_07885 [Aquibacillus sp. 3ASR75-11]|uniref:Uncharacterized protein n=1 Tax=Terrihalobacillus insolitus TaxID=2950438 RepID=A0A9X3WR99_9BACI|nr:hypothetical protein [Terrihalobacillus insolitus]MDC3424427.1 hypothetical protein [Terrihalobacillus insolitus]
MGDAWILNQIWTKLGLDEIIQKLLKDMNHQTEIERFIFAMVSNRSLIPTSHRANRRLDSR